LACITATHAVCRDVLRSDDFGVVGDAQLPALARRLARWAHDPRLLGPLAPPSMLAVDPPDHTRYRRLVTQVFTPKAVRGLEGHVQLLADELLDAVAVRRASEPFDLVEHYASLLPVRVIAHVLGVPRREHARLLALGNQVAASLDLGLTWRDSRRVEAGLREFNAWLGAHLAHLRRHPGDDLMSELVALEDDGGLDDAELRATAGLVLAAGFETTVNLLGSGALLLMRAPEQRDLLRHRPELWPNAVEEALRVESPVQLTGRTALRDTHVAGVRVPAGSIVTTLLAGANRDPDVFSSPDAFDVARENARDHLSFSGGRHFCLGAALARVEGDIGLRSLFERFPDLRPAPGARRRRTRVLRGWEVLPVLR
jgi:cytochrome P450